MTKKVKSTQDLKEQIEELDGESKKLIDMMAKNRTYPFCSKKGKIFFRGVQENVFAEETQDRIIEHFEICTKEDCNKIREVARKRAEKLRTTHPVKDWVESDRPREKLVKHGSEFLKNSELLAILLGRGYSGKSAVHLARDILRKYKSENLPKVSHKELIKEKGVGQASACKIKAAFELAKRLLLEQDENAIIISTPEEVYNFLEKIKDYKKEHFIGLYLNARNQLIHQETVSVGTLTANIVHPREVFSPALKHHTASVFLAHNHPSGDPEPSRLDIKITKDLVKSGDILGIKVIDHVIISKNDYFSFNDEDYI